MALSDGPAQGRNDDNVWDFGQCQGRCEGEALHCKACDGDGQFLIAGGRGWSQPELAVGVPANVASPQSMSSKVEAGRRPSKAARALQQFGAACRRLSEVSGFSSLSAASYSAVSWAIPKMSFTRPSAGCPVDVETAPELCRPNDGSGSGVLNRACSQPRQTGGSATPDASPSASPSKPEQEHVNENANGSGPQPEGRAHHPSGLRVCSASAARSGLPAGCGVSSSEATGRSGDGSGEGSGSGGGGGSGGLSSGHSRRRASVAECVADPSASSASHSTGSGSATTLGRWMQTPPPPPPLPPPPAAAATAAPSRPSPHAQAGLFKPRPTPADGLVYLAPCARSCMWSPERGGRWSLRQYDLVRGLYRGYASTVYKAVCLTSGQLVALKVYNLAALTDFLRHQVLRELDIHSRLNKHPGIVQLLAAFREGDALVLVLEYVQGATLAAARQRLGGRLPEQRAAHLVVLPLLRVLSYVHRQGVVHRDIKPENLLFTPDWRLKLIDFGVALCLGDERAVTRAGSNEYMAPEVHACPLKLGPADNKVNERLAYGAAADVWSLGAVVYELLVGFPPFPGGPPPGPKRGGGAARPTAIAIVAGATAAGASAGAAEGPVPEPSCDADADADSDANSIAAAGASGTAAEAEAEAEAPAAAATAPARERGVSDSVGVPATAAAAAGGGGGGGSSRATALAFPAGVSPAARAFVCACLEPHPGDRPTVEQLLWHPWLQGAQQGWAGQPSTD